MNQSELVSDQECFMHQIESRTHLNHTTDAITLLTLCDAPLPPPHYDLCYELRYP